MGWTYCTQDNENDIATVLNYWSIVLIASYCASKQSELYTQWSMICLIKLEVLPPNNNMWRYKIIDLEPIILGSMTNLCLQKKTYKPIELLFIRRRTGKMVSQFFFIFRLLYCSSMYVNHLMSPSGYTVPHKGIWLPLNKLFSVLLLCIDEPYCSWK